ncbi:MAG: selenocysteine-specific translation elongation factor, partial [Actinobacteria bacterium]|nr:selenocysteine-specific translation elongation factor [Actinomycetota bacterium]
MRTIATAGHVDHGKSSLVLALTGTDPDRFPEEKARGLTIDLGFAFATLPSGTEIAFVDVPGHVRFIKNMLAGVGAVDLALLVVAATEGWMPQTEEHLRILELLGVAHGMVAITKADLVDDETLELAELEIVEHLEGTPLADAPIVVCDSLSGRGLDDVRRTLDAVLTDAPSARDVERPRLWVDRVFAAKGAGTVVTGTLTGGAVAVDDELEVGGRGLRVRVRGIESAKRQHPSIGPGNRVALNLVGVEHRDLARGDALVRPGQWATPAVVDVGVQVVPGEKLARRNRVQVYAGSGEHGATFRVLDPQSRFARLRLETPLPLAPGDRLVLRDPGKGRTVAGVEVLDVAPTRKAADAAAVLGLPLGERLIAAHRWVPVADLGRLAGLPDGEVDGFVAGLVTDGIAERADDWLVEPATRTRLRDETRTRVAAFHRDAPNEPGLDLGVVARALREDPARLRAALADTPGLVVERGIVRDASHVGAVAETPEAQALVARFAASPYAPPAPD